VKKIIIVFIILFSRLSLSTSEDRKFITTLNTLLPTGTYEGISNFQTKCRFKIESYISKEDHHFATIHATDWRNDKGLEKVEVQMILSEHPDYVHPRIEFLDHALVRIQSGALQISARTLKEGKSKQRFFDVFCPRLRALT